MYGKKIALASVLAVCTLPLVSYAIDVSVVNNTDAYATGQLRFSPCSSSIGSAGIIKPHSTMTASLGILKAACLGGACDAHIYASQNCSGKEIATVTVSANDGIIKIKNLDTAEYVVSGNGAYGSIDAVSRGWKRWFSWLF